MRLILTLILLAAPLAAQFTSAHSIWGRPITPTAPTDGYALVWSASQGKFIFSAGVGPSSNQNIRTPGAYFSTSSATVVCSNVGYAGTITGVKVWSDATITATVDVKTVAFASFTGAASASSITAGSPATITAGTNAGPSISGWTTAIAANTMVCFVPSAITAGSASYFVAQLQISAN